MKKLLCLTAFLLFSAMAAFGDIPRPEIPTPKPTPKIKTTNAQMTIRLDTDATDATLVIPKSQLKALRAQLDELDGGASDSTVANAGMFSRSQTIASGMFLSLAVIFGGVWFARNRKTDGKTGKTIAAAAVLLLVGSAATIAFANAGPPSVLRSISADLFNKEAFRYWNRAHGNVKIQISKDESDSIELIVPDKKEVTAPKND